MPSEDATTEPCTFAGPIDRSRDDVMGPRNVRRALVGRALATQCSPPKLEGRRY
jgi:hypothetical protein